MPISLTSSPRPVPFGLYGGAAGLLVALVFGELLWWLLHPPAPELDSPSAPPPTAQLAVSASPKVSVYPGEKNTVIAWVARNRYTGPVSVKFAPPPGVSAADFTINAGDSGGAAEVTAHPGTKPGVYRMPVTASAAIDGKLVTAGASVEVTVVAIPPPPPRLAVTTSPRLPAYRRGKNTFAVRIARGEFDDPVTVSADTLPEGVRVPPITIPAGATEATGELTVAGGAPVGPRPVTVTARAEPKGGAISADASAVVDVLVSPKVPVDVVFALDCTGSMKKTVEGVSTRALKFADELAKANLDVRFGLVGFQDTTFGQPLKVPRLDGERMSERAIALSTAMQGLRLGGGGGEGESSLDGIAEAADCPGRADAVRVIVLITDGGPKRSDGRMKSTEETVKYLRVKKVDQLQVVALPEHRKQFEPLWAGARGKYFDLKAVSEADAFDELMADVARAIAEAIPEPPPAKAEPGGAAPNPVLPQLGSVPPPPPGAQPDEPKCDTVENPAEKAVNEPKPAPAEAKAGLAVLAWCVSIVCLVCGAVVVGRWMVLPGHAPSVGVAVAGYGVGVIVGVLAALLGAVACSLIGAPSVLERIVGASVFGVCVGASAALAERVARQPAKPLQGVQPVPRPIPSEQPLELDDEPVPVTPAVPSHKPTIAAPKPRDGCPGCGRVIPSARGKRYCMVCDRTY